MWGRWRCQPMVGGSRRERGTGCHSSAGCGGPAIRVRVRTRLMASPEDAAVLGALGRHLASLAGTDLARRSREGRLQAKRRAASRRERKQALTSACSSRWAGAITRTSEDAWGVAERNLIAEAVTLRARIDRIRRRLAVPVGGRCGRNRGYESAGERYQKQRRLQVLQFRLVRVEARLDDGRVSICRGGRRLAQARHHLDEVGITAVQWQQRWQASRLFICADGEADKRWGNETIRFHPDKGWVEIKLPAPLAYLANRPHGRWRLATPVAFAHRGDEVAAQAATGAVRYDICYEPDRQRWYLDASWKTPTTTSPSVDELGEDPVLAVDINAGHLAAVVVDSCGNPMGVPVTISLDLAGLSTPTRDGRLRAAVSSLLGLAGTHGCRAVVIEDLDFAAAREQGRERTSRRPSRGRRGRSFRRLVAGIPTAQFRDRLVQMTANRGLWVVAVDPAYTSQWGAEHWLGALRQLSPEASGHHAAALVIGRRGLRQRARRRERCDSTRPEDRQERATNSAVRAMPAPAGLSEQHSREPGNRKARGQPYPRRKDPTGRPITPRRPGDPRPFGAAHQRDSVPLSV